MCRSGFTSALPRPRSGLPARGEGAPRDPPLADGAGSLYYVAPQVRKQLRSDVLTDVATLVATLGRPAAECGEHRRVRRHVRPDQLVRAVPHLLELQG